ncbi:MAG: ribonuclease P protein component [Patescibacteria group bacterium]|nr:ribonuclease P protein component [Patescibacteria group bacterium]
MLPIKHRLTKKKDFERVFKKGKSERKGFLVLKFLKTNFPQSRIGFVVSQKVAKKAVLRNKIKRRQREIVRMNLPKLKSGYDLVILSRKGIGEKDFKETKRDVETLLKKAKLLKEI